MKEGIVAKTAYYEFYLLQPVKEVEAIEKYRPMKRSFHQSSQQDGFASLFQKARKRHAANKQQSISGSFDAIC